VRSGGDGRATGGAAISIRYLTAGPAEGIGGFTGAGALLMPFALPDTGAGGGGGAGGAPGPLGGGGGGGVPVPPGGGGGGTGPAPGGGGGAPS